MLDFRIGIGMLFGPVALEMEEMSDIYFLTIYVTEIFITSLLTPVLMTKLENIYLKSPPFLNPQNQTAFQSLF